MAARFGAVRASTAQGFELDIITVVLLGGVEHLSVASARWWACCSRSLLVLNLRNGMTIAGITGNTQTGIIGLLLILSVLIPNLAARAHRTLRAQADPSIRNFRRRARKRPRQRRRLRGGVPHTREHAFLRLRISM